MTEQIQSGTSVLNIADNKETRRIKKEEAKDKEYLDKIKNMKLGELVNALAMALDNYDHKQWDRDSPYHSAAGHNEDIYNEYVKKSGIIIAELNTREERYKLSEA